MSCYLMEVKRSVADIYVVKMYVAGCFEKRYEVGTCLTRRVFIELTLVSIIKKQKLFRLGELVLV